MKRTFEIIGYIVLIAIVAVLLSEDGRTKVFNLFRSKPYLELTGNSPYDLTISEFSWGYGVVVVNQFNGDFDKLDEKVYDLLKGKTGICRVNIKGTTKDKYGKADGSLQYIGDINIDELNKYQDWKYWQREAGIRTLLYKYLVIPTLDSTKIDTIISTKVKVKEDTTSTPMRFNNPNVEQPTSYIFSLDDLYASGRHPSIAEDNRWVINGTISEVHFEEGAMRINTSDGEIAVQFHPTEANPNIIPRLRTAFEANNTIRCIVTKQDSLNCQLIAAKVTMHWAAKRM